MKTRSRTIEVGPFEGLFAVLADGAPIRTPAGHVLAVASRSLAEAICVEWRAQPDQPVPRTMPLTQLAVTAIDRITPNRDAVVAACIAYAETDLLCYRADMPPSLSSLQARVWQPVLDWLALRFDATLVPHVGLMPRSQAPEALAALKLAVGSYDDMRLTALQLLCGLMGSLALALALVDGRLDAEAAFEAAELDESHQIEQWGADPEAIRRRETLLSDIRAVRRFLDLTQG